MWHRNRLGSGLTKALDARVGFGSLSGCLEEQGIDHPSRMIWRKPYLESENQLSSPFGFLLLWEASVIWVPSKHHISFHFCFFLS